MVLVGVILEGEGKVVMVGLVFRIIGVLGNGDLVIIFGLVLGGIMAIVMGWLRFNVVFIGWIGWVMLF